MGAYAYDPYGAYTTTTSTGSAAGLNPYRSAGGIYDRNTGWIKYGERWYNPATGRFTQLDSVERFTDPKNGNRYAYAADNPINYVDPCGRFPWPSIGDFACFVNCLNSYLSFDCANNCLACFLDSNAFACYLCFVCGGTAYDTCLTRCYG